MEEREDVESSQSLLPLLAPTRPCKSAIRRPHGLRRCTYLVVPDSPPLAGRKQWVRRARRVEPFPRVSATGRCEESSWWGEGGETASGSVRSCLIPELTASPFLRQTQHPTVLAPRTDAHASLLHATFRALPPHPNTSGELLCCARPTLLPKWNGGGCGGCCL